MAKKVLVVDDEKLIVKGIRFSLEQDGMEVTCAYDGEEALRLAQENKFDMILLDIMLPKMDGFEVCQAIREFSNMPIVMLTAKGDDMDKILGLEYGADDYITKPFNILEVKARIKAIMRRTAASEPKEGKIEIRAAADGLLKIHSEKLRAVNGLGEMMIATIHGNFPVKAGDRLAATRIIPLVIEEEKMNRAKEAAGGEPLLKILPMSHKKVGIVTTGSEVFKGRIQDAFGPAIRAKLAAYDTEVMGQVILDDCQEDISAAILKFVRQGADMVLCTGGMSVDPDDRTPGAIKATGADIVSYGAPVLPGAMFLLSYLGEIPVLGLPGCVMYAGRTVFDLVLPRVLAGERLTKADLDSYGEGGLCLNCEVCHFPNCGFGKQ